MWRIVILTACVACASAPRPEALIALDRAFEGGAPIDTTDTAAAASLATARELYAQADAAHQDGQPEDALRYALEARLHLDIASEQARIAVARERINKALQRQHEATEEETAQNDRYEKYQKRVARMEKILALQANLESEQEKSKKEREALQREIEQNKEEQKRLEEEQRRADEEQQKKLAFERERAAAQNEIAQVQSKVQTADSLQAEKFDSSSVRSAKSMLAESQRALDRGDLTAARQFSQTADQSISAAIKIAREEYAKRQKELDVLAQRNALLKAAGEVGASGAHQEERGVVITLHDMFAPTEFTILEERKPLLDAIAQLAAGYPDYPLVIEGYTDSQGNEEHNLKLSVSRALSVQQYLVNERNIPADRVRSAGYGESKPVADNSTRDGRAKNRRIEVVFLFR